MAYGTLRKPFTKPVPQPAAPDCISLSPPHLLDLRHDFVGVPRGRSLHTPREAEGARLHLARNTADAAALIDGVAERIGKKMMIRGLSERRDDPMEDHQRYQESWSLAMFGFLCS